jgi:NifU-like protein involved in Fe-S cluster formation
MTTATALYTPQVLALATSLAAFPLDETLPLQTTTRSKSCGSSLTLGLATDPGGAIARIGLKAQACAIGQAAAAIFAQGAPGRSPADIAAAEAGLAEWLSGAGEQPDWPGLELLAPACAYPARHGAIKLAWMAARELLPTNGLPR